MCPVCGIVVPCPIGASGLADHTNVLILIEFFLREAWGLLAVDHAAVNERIHTSRSSPLGKGEVAKHQGCFWEVSAFADGFVNALLSWSIAFSLNKLQSWLCSLSLLSKCVCWGPLQAGAHHPTASCVEKWLEHLGDLAELAAPCRCPGEPSIHSFRLDFHLMAERSNGAELGYWLWWSNQMAFRGKKWHVEQLGLTAERWLQEAVFCAGGHHSNNAGWFLSVAALPAELCMCAAVFVLFWFLCVHFFCCCLCTEPLCVAEQTLLDEGSLAWDGCCRMQWGRGANPGSGCTCKVWWLLITICCFLVLTKLELVAICGAGGRYGDGAEPVCY